MENLNVQLNKQIENLITPNRNDFSNENEDETISFTNLFSKSMDNNLEITQQITNPILENQLHFDLTPTISNKQTLPSLLTVSSTLTNANILAPVTETTEMTKTNSMNKLLNVKKCNENKFVNKHKILRNFKTTTTTTTTTRTTTTTPTNTSINNTTNHDDSKSNSNINLSLNNDSHCKTTHSLLHQIKSQFRIFCETTSLRGIPRIVNTKDSKRRFLWLIFVLVFFIGCIICLTFIINQYLEFDVIHQPKKIYDQPRPFPSVTLCNLRPFSTRDIRKLKQAGVLPVDMYFELIKRLMNYIPINKRTYLTMLWDFTAYLANLPNTVDINHLGHSLQDIVKRCFILYKTGSVTRGTACDKSGYWTKTQDRVFHNCYTYTVNPNRTNMALNMELVLYLDNMVEQTDCFDCQERVMASQLTGARLLLHPGASYPRVAEEGINLMPGTMTDIRFTVYEWSMMEPPHGRCSKNTPSFISFNNVNYTFSEEACHAQMVQQKVASNCECLTQHLPIPTKLLKHNLRKCQNFKLPAVYETLNNLNRSRELYFSDEAISNFVNFAGCAERTGTAIEGYQTGCRPACVRYTYKPSITAAQWPTKTFLTWFVTKFLNEMESHEMLRIKSDDRKALEILNERMLEIRKSLLPYEEIANLTKQGKLDEAIQMLMKLQIFEQNFLSIIISRPNFDLERVEEKAVVSLTSLFSQIGGLLSIWIGLTFVCIVELVELCLNVADAVVHHRQQKNY